MMSVSGQRAAARKLRSLWGPILVGVAAALGGLTLWAAKSYESRLDAVNHTVTVQRRITSVLSVLQDAETGQRGYLLTGDAKYLGPFEGARRRLGAEIGALAREVSDNAPQHQAALALEPLIDAKFRELDHTIDLRRSGDVAAALAIVRNDSGRQTMDQLRDRIADMGRTEGLLLARRTEEGKVYGYVASALLLGLVLVIVAGLTLALWRARRAATVLRQARDDAEAAHRTIAAEIRERERIEGQMRQLQKIDAIGQLTGGIAHDFNNMLAIVIGNLELARRRIDDRPKVLQAIDYALEGATKGANLTKRLLAFSRQQPLEPRTLNLNKLVGGMSELLTRSLGETISIETVLGGGLWKTFVDPGEIESAILNLAINARDAMPDGGRLTIETTNAHLDDIYVQMNPGARAGQYVLICVSDTGSGMPPEVIARAFDPFFTTKAAGKGTGLGLSQIHGFIQQSGGHVRIYSEPGTGTTVKMYLPRRHGEDEAASPLQAAAEAVVPEGSAEQLILVVEDEDGVRRMSVETLRSLGYTVRHASDGPTALKLLEELGEVSLLLTDVVMPGMTGKELATAALARRPDLPVLYTTGYTRNAVVHGGIVDPGVAFLPKPFTVEQLANKVSETITRH
jgi:signal transduction histidine kinase/ActR/RegA family two-component response regulator